MYSKCGAGGGGERPRHLTLVYLIKLFSKKEEKKKVLKNVFKVELKDTKWHQDEQGAMKHLVTVHISWSAPKYRTLNYLNGGGLISII